MITLLCFMFIVGVIVLLLLNSLYRRSIAYKNTNVDILKFKNKIPENLKLVSFGSTYAMYAFNSYSNLNLNAFNFSIEAQSLEIDNILLRKYSSHLAPGAIVVFGLAACVTYYRYSMVTNKLRYYDFLNKNDIPDYSIIKALKHYFPLPLFHLKRMVKSYIKQRELKDIYTNYPSSLSQDMMKKNMKGMANGWISLFNLCDLKQKDNNSNNEQNKNFNTKLLRSMFEFCLSKGWKPIVVITPFSDILNKYFGDEFISFSLGDMVNKASENLDVEILDYRTHPSFQQDYNLYLDGGFRLNLKGSIKFVKLLLQDLNFRGYNLSNSTIGC